MKKNLLRELEEAERKAWDSLSRHEFQMFGYWASIWEQLNRIGGFKKSNPWEELVEIADKREGFIEHVCGLQGFNPNIDRCKACEEWFK